MRGPFPGWIIANFVGFAALGALITLLPLLISISGLVASTLVIGIPIGIAQWIALRRHTPISVIWILTISLGLFISIRAIMEMPPSAWDLVPDESIQGLTAIPAGIGLIVGLVQWVLLRRHFRKSAVWPFGSSAGLALASFLVLTTGLINQSGLISAILAVLVYAVATGLALEWLHRQASKPHRHLPSST